MSYTSVPNTFTSATTLFATAMTGNFTAITNGLSSGSNDLNLYSIGASTFNVSSTVACVSSTNVEGTSTIATSGTGDSLTNSGTATINKLTLGVPETCTISSNSITPSKSFVTVEGASLLTITTTNFVAGDILILTKGSVAVTVANGTNMKLGATRTLTNASDKLVLQLVDSYWYELQYQSNG